MDQRERCQARLSNSLIDSRVRGLCSSLLPRDMSYPLHDAWSTLVFGTNEHYAVACALGVGGLSREPRPVTRTRPFFAHLVNLGLIDSDGNASHELVAEAKAMVEMSERQKVARQLLENGSEDPEMRETLAAAAMLARTAECKNCKRHRGNTMSKCPACGVYFG